MKKNLKKIIAVLVVIGSFVGYVLTQRSSTQNPIVASNAATSDNNNQPIIVTTNTPTPVTTVSPTPKPTTTPTPVTTPKSKTTGVYADGTYTGKVADAYYGSMQVQAVIKNGLLADVIFLQYPNDRGTSVRINTEAMPKLKSEAISAQSAKVNTVSGATQSSQGFQQTLQSALDQAKSA